MSTPLLLLVTSSIAAVILTVFYRYEDKKGGRVFLSGIRNLLDRIIMAVAGLLEKILNGFVKKFARILFHYGAHHLLKKLLNLVKLIEGKVERLIRQNKAIAKGVIENKERNHLDEIADHKAESALTEEQKQKLKMQ